MTLLALALAAALAGDGAPGATGAAELDPLHQWGQWRGPLGTGEAPHADPPLVWSEREHVRWKVPIPGKGHGAPLVFGERVYLTAALPAEALAEPIPDTSPGGHDNAPITHQQVWVVLALERASGALAWQTEVSHALPHQGAHETASFASSSPATDGERIYASFGSRGVYALDAEGHTLWRADLGQMHVKHGHGEGSSPALFGDTLVVNWDHEGPSFVAALDAATGQERWRVPRDEETSWASPIVVEHDGVPQAIVSGTQRIRSYAWPTAPCSGSAAACRRTSSPRPSPRAGLVFAGSSYETRRLLAIRLGGSGDLTGGERVVWSRTEGTPYVPSPLLYGDALYVVRHYQNVLTRLEAATGAERPGALRLAGLHDIYASPLAAAGRIYVTDLSGTTAVLSHADEPRVLATNHLDDSFAASPAAAGDALFLRGEHFLYCLAD